MSRPVAQPATPNTTGSGPTNKNSVSTESVSLSATVQARDYPAYLSHYFFPRHLQRHFLALRAFNIELAGIKENVSSEILGRIRIGWWRDAIKACYNKRPPKHPVAIALAEAIHDPALQASGGLVQDHFQRIIEAREQDLASPLTPPTLADIEQYTESTSSRLFYLSLNLLGTDDRGLDEIFSHLGKAAGLSLLLASVPFHAGFATQAPAAAGPSTTTYRPSMLRGQKRLVLPLEYLHKHNVVEEDVFRRANAAKGIQDAVFDTATRANDYLITARTLIRERSSGKLDARLAGPLTGAIPSRFFLEQLERHEFDVFHPELQQAAAGRNWKLSWAVWRGSRKRNV